MADSRSKADILAEIEALVQERKDWQKAAFQESEKKHEALRELKKVQRELNDLKARDRSPRRSVLCPLKR